MTKNDPRGSDLVGEADAIPVAHSVSCGNSAHINDRAREAGDTSLVSYAARYASSESFFSRKPTASAVGYGYGVSFADSAFLVSTGSRRLPVLFSVPTLMQKDRATDD